ncbi:MAG: pyridoxal-phosphate dependent enzyme [Actinomycetota bacterium]
MVAVEPTDNVASPEVPSLADIDAANERIAPHILATPVLTDDQLDEQLGASLFFKAEGLQPPGAFKVRGATNAVFSLSDDRAANGVITHSSGNHGAALAYAAGRRGIPCQVVMPTNAPSVKKAAVASYGAEIIECEPAASARQATMEEVRAVSGAEFVHPYDDPRVVAGQATCARELLDQVDGLDVVLAPIGGGGLVSGTCLTVAAVAPTVDVVAAEPEQADDAARSLEAGRLIADDAPVTIADGLKTPLGPLTWHIVSRHVAAILTVSEQEIVEAMRLAWERLRIVVEPSSAVAIAAVRRHPERFAGRRVGVILSGGNVDLDRLPWATDTGAGAGPTTGS